MAEQSAFPPAASGGVTKKKFTTPPVKSACLACRAARTRCDGAKPCATCLSRSRDCIYTPSRRGGPRNRKKVRVTRDVTEEEPRQIPDDVFAMLSQEPADVSRNPIRLQNYIDPGAGLKHLEDWVQDSDFIFDSLFLSSTGPIAGNGFVSDVSVGGTPPLAVPMVRTYKSNATILDAYYVFIHSFLPIMPAPINVPLDQPIPRLQNQMDVFEDSFEPSSPVALAISAILALIPCPDDTDHQSQEARLFRRKYAQYFAQSAFEAIEMEEEIPDSSFEPQRALSEEHRHPFRQPFHPRVPVELESIIALNILSVYEYAQRGNLKKMQNRAGQALMAAMDLSLHSSMVEDEFSEARRRVWWMSYVCAAQGAIVSNTKPNFIVFSPSYTTKFPTFLADPEAFSVYLEAERAILAATQFVIELKRAMKENDDMNSIYEKMKELEAFMEPLLSQSETWLLTATTTSSVDITEEVVTRSLRSIARIKLNSARIKVHRYCAFFDTPIFTRKHCDLKSLNSADDGDELQRWPSCSCSSFGPNLLNFPTSTNSSTNGGATSTGFSPSSSPGGTGFGHGGSSITTTPPPHTMVMGDGMMTTTTTMTATGNNANANTNANTNNNNTTHIYSPFSSHQSAKICLRSALNIAHAFDDLPFPNPTGVIQIEGPPVFLSPTSAIVSPRTMPNFACCAMQCAYALLMVYQKTKAMYPTYPNSISNGSNNNNNNNSINNNSSGGVPGGAGVAVAVGVEGSPSSRPIAVESLLFRLQQGLTSIYATLSNYATAFEALGGMRDQIKAAIEESAEFPI